MAKKYLVPLSDDERAQFVAFIKQVNGGFLVIAAVMAN
jgi:hypothetical protein